ncbi:MAG: helix-turn-helix domain-containing protein [Ruminococcaceae bacterium]|nr:helix-turn-helix domain-containing protein [Oscillospiraceae bacterium]
MSRLTLAERIVIECGIYEKLKLSEIARKIGKSPESVSGEIRANRTIAPGEDHFGKDCHFTGECKTKGLCGKEGCSKRCGSCREYDCRELCTRYNNSSCVVLSKPPYVCNVCVRRRKYKGDRAYYIARQADAMARLRYSDSRSNIQTRGEALERLD